MDKKKDKNLENNTYILSTFMKMDVDYVVAILTNRIKNATIEALEKVKDTSFEAHFASYDGMPTCLTDAAEASKLCIENYLKTKHGIEGTFNFKSNTLYIPFKQFFEKTA